MVSLRTALLAGAVGLAACSGGGGGNGGSASGGGGSGGGGGGSETLTLYDAIRQGTDVSIATKNGLGAGQTSFATNFDLVVSNTGQDPVSFPDAKKYTASPGAYQYTTDDRSDFAIGIVPPSDGSSGYLTYTTFGFWGLSDQPGFVDQETFGGPLTASGAFYGGVRTPTDNLPASGGASYTGRSVALEVNPDTSTALDIWAGDFTATADFGAGTISGRANLESFNDFDSTMAVNMGEMAISRADASFAGDNVTSTRGHTGTVEGAFFGPEAQELGGAFVINKSGSRVTGSFGAEQ